MFAVLVLGLIGACGDEAGLPTDGSIGDTRVDAVAFDAATPMRQGPPSGAMFDQISLNGGGGCGLKSDGSLRCWGATSSCEQGLSSLACPPLGEFIEVVVGGESVCGIEDGGHVLCTTSVDEIAPIDATYMAFAAGPGLVCGIKLNGELECTRLWGLVEPGPTGPMTEISIGRAYACAIRLDGGLSCWRVRDYATSPEELIVPDGEFVAVVNQYDRHGTFEPEGACALRGDGRVSCFDADGLSEAPVGEFVQLAAGADHYCARREDGTVACWGRGESDHECGNNSAFSSVFVKECGQAKPPADTFVWIAAADNYTCGLKVDGDVTCWGHLPWDVCASENSAGTLCPHH